jgi:ribosomal protein L13
VVRVRLVPGTGQFNLDGRSLEAYFPNKVHQQLIKEPLVTVEKAVRGMLPKNSLGRQMLRKLKVYAGPEHPHAAQKPQPFEITQVSQ